jgi:hypothetical protein
VRTVSVRYNILNIFRCLRNTEPAHRHELIPHISNSIRDLVSLESNLKAWGLSAPPEYSYTVVDVQSRPFAPENQHLFYSSKAYVYKDYSYSHAWNRCRGARLIVNGLIKKAAGWAHILAHPNERINLDTIPGRAESRQTVQQLVDDVCCSVPYQFGATGTNSASATSSSAVAQHVYTLVWPLIFCAGVGHISTLQREWIKTTLDLIGRITDSSLVISIAKASISMSTMFTTKQTDRPQMDLLNHSCLLKFDLEHTPVASPQDDNVLASDMSPS